jgi:hypothetical protein
MTFYSNGVRWCIASQMHGTFIFSFLLLISNYLLPPFGGIFPRSSCDFVPAASARTLVIPLDSARAITFRWSFRGDFSIARIGSDMPDRILHLRKRQSRHLFSPTTAKERMFTTEERGDRRFNDGKDVENLGKIMTYFVAKYHCMCTIYIDICLPYSL